MYANFQAVEILDTLREMWSVTPWTSVLFYKLTVHQLVPEFPVFAKSKISVMCSPELATGPNTPT